jgi:hypothetical protein
MHVLVQTHIRPVLRAYDDIQHELHYLLLLASTTMPSCFGHIIHIHLFSQYAQYPHMIYQWIHNHVARAYIQSFRVVDNKSLNQLLFLPNLLGLLLSPSLFSQFLPISLNFSRLVSLTDLAGDVSIFSLGTGRTSV